MTTDNTQELDDILWSINPEQVDATVEEAIQAILDWHNKQVEEVLDRLEAADNISDSASSQAIEEERNKLKESN